MTKHPTDLKATDLQRIGVSKPYAHQLLAGLRTPSLKLAVQVEAEFGIPPKAWLDAANDDTAPSEAA
jgi:transcriptional regulator with XRE-family HTH domain